MSNGEKRTSFDYYIKEINTIPLLSREEEFELAVRYKNNNDFIAARQLILSNLRFVLLIVNEYKSYKIHQSDLIQEGNMGLMKSIGKFDPYKGYRLISYAVWWIRAYIQNFIIRSISIVKMGTNKTQKMLFYKNSGNSEPVEENMASSPLFANIQEGYGMKSEDVVRKDLTTGYRDFSLDQMINKDATITYLDLMPCEQYNPEENFICSEEERLLKEAVVSAMIHLNEKEEYIITHRVMADAPLTLQQIATKFDLSKERIRQIEMEALSKIRGRISSETSVSPTMN